MSIAFKFTLASMMGMGTHIPGRQLGFDILLKDPWAYLGLAFLACANYSYFCMERTLKELGKPWAPAVVPFGVTTRYRKHCHHEGRTPWLAYLFWIFLAAAIECIVYSIFWLSRQPK
jgi:hypothetical protein